MKLIEIRSPDFDLAKTLDSGQVFHWQKVGNGFVGTIGDLPVYVTQEDDVLKVRCGATPQPTRETHMRSCMGYLDSALSSGREAWPKTYRQPVGVRT